MSLSYGHVIHRFVIEPVLVISEGRNRQVRRMTAAVGFPTLRLVRVNIGEWSVHGLGVGQWREIEVSRHQLR